MPAGAIPISTVDELAMIGYEYPGDGYYYLTGDIDATKATSKGGDYYNEGLGFEPIGNSDTPFTGTFDGQGFAIIGLNINRPEEENIGLFGYTNGATIKNVVTKDGSIIGKTKVGGIVGQAINSTIVGSDNGNSVTANTDGNYAVGGIVGYAPRNVYRQ